MRLITWEGDKVTEKRGIYLPNFPIVKENERTWEIDFQDAMEMFRWSNSLVALNPRSKSRRKMLEVDKRKLERLMKSKPPNKRQKDFNPFKVRGR